MMPIKQMVEVIDSSGVKRARIINLTKFSSVVLGARIQLVVKTFRKNIKRYLVKKDSIQNAVVIALAKPSVRSDGTKFQCKFTTVILVNFGKNFDDSMTRTHNVFPMFSNYKINLPFEIVKMYPNFQSILKKIF